MLPKNKLASAQIGKLKIYAGPDHPARGPGPRGIACRSAAGQSLAYAATIPPGAASVSITMQKTWNRSPARSLAAGTSSTPRGRPSGVSRRRSPTRSAARASPSTRRTWTAATSSSSSTRRRSTSRATSSTRRCTTATPAIPAGLRSRTLRAAARAPADRGAPQGGQGHAPAEQARERPDRQAEDLRRPRASARGAEPRAAGELTLDVSEIAQYRGTGKRKTSVARVILRPGDGTTWFNGRTLDDYFPRLTDRMKVLAPLKAAGLEGTYDLRVRVHGGGPTGQAEACRHGIARALVEADPELRTVLKKEGFLARDARIVERKKAGLHKARKAPQFSSASFAPHGAPLLRHRRCPRGRRRGPDPAARRAARPRVHALGRAAARSSSAATRAPPAASSSARSRAASPRPAATRCSPASCRRRPSRCSRSTSASSSPPRTTRPSTTASSSSRRTAASSPTPTRRRSRRCSTPRRRTWRAARSTTSRSPSTATSTTSSTASAPTSRGSGSASTARTARTPGSRRAPSRSSAPR